jgi:sulfotransferase family protein
MIRLIKATISHVRGKAVAGRNVIVFPDDVFLVSYGKSGNTWSRFLIANLTHPQEPTTFLNVERRIPDIYVNSQEFMLMLPRPRILKSHETFDPRYKKVIYIVRDPRDVAVSLYHWLIKRRVLPDGYPIDQYVLRFLTGEFTETSGSWSDNVLTWLATRQNTRNFLLLRYEDMLRDPLEQLRKAASFLNVDSNAERLQRAVELSSADRMRKLEQVQSLQWKCTQNDRQDIPFVRTATAGKWSKELPERSVAEIELAWGNTMRLLGYELVTRNTDVEGIPEWSALCLNPA